MFTLDGEPTHISRVIETLLRQFLKPYGDRITCIVYRKDPLDNYLFTTALLGLRQQEPMFGPLVWDDRRRDRPTAPENPLGFSSRERIPPGCHAKFEHEHWEAHFSGRTDKQEFQECVDLLREELEPCLEDLLGNSDRKPLFPDLWYKERLARDRMRDEFRNLSPGMNLEDIASALTRSLKSMADDLLPGGNQNHVGLYFNTTKDWILLGSSLIPRRLPQRVGGCCETVNDERNAFNWVDFSTRPVLLRRNLSEVWQKRLDGCGPDLAEVSREDDFAGICIVPLLDLNQPSRSMGVALLVSIGRRQVAPAHVFLMSRVALAAAGYLTPFLPIPGYPRWPNVSLSRGGANVNWARAPEPADARKRVVEMFAKELMPIGSDVLVEPLESGQSGAAVFRLEVKDRKKMREVPRVLKIHGEKEIVEELRHYYEFVHNKSVGGTSRIDIAKVGSVDDHDWGAIVYILVGAGEEAQPWSRWAKSASRALIESGLQRLYDQLLCWYNTTEPVPKNPIDLLITTPFVENHWAPTLQAAEKPSWSEVSRRLEELSEKHRQKGQTRTCVVHGDLHAGNIFSLIGKPLHRSSTRDRRDDGNLSAVAVIDWGSVRDGRHPLSDVAKLMADLHYKVRWKVGDRLAERKWAFGIIKEWGARLGFPEMAWIPPLLHQVSKMLFYISPGDPQKPYLSNDARAQAWQDMEELMSMLDNPKGSPRAQKARKKAPNRRPDTEP